MKEEQGSSYKEFIRELHFRSFYNFFLTFKTPSMTFNNDFNNTATIPTLIKKNDAV